jgi:hypothetical protein
LGKRRAEEGFVGVVGADDDFAVAGFGEEGADDGFTVAGFEKGGVDDGFAGAGFGERGVDDSFAREDRRWFCWSWIWERRGR